MNLHKRKELKNNWREHLAESKAKHMATFVFNRPISIDRAKSLLDKFCETLQKETLDPNALRHSKTKFQMISFPEHVLTNLHFHALIRMSTRFERSWLARADAIWKRLCPSGAIDFAEIENKRKAAGYCVKELSMAGRLEHVQIFTLDPQSPVAARQPTGAVSPSPLRLIAQNKPSKHRGSRRNK